MTNWLGPDWTARIRPRIPPGDTPGSPAPAAGEPISFTPFAVGSRASPTRARVDRRGFGHAAAEQRVHGPRDSGAWHPRQARSATAATKFLPNEPRPGRAAHRPGRLGALSALRRAGVVERPASLDMWYVRDVQGLGAARRRGLPAARGQPAPALVAPGARRVVLPCRSLVALPAHGIFRSGRRRSC